MLAIDYTAQNRIWGTILNNGLPIYRLIFGFVFSLITCYLVTPVVIKVAHHVNALDHPKDERRIHKKPMPLIGGLGIYISVMLALMIFVDMPQSKVLSLMLGSSLIVFMGIVDDINPLPAKYKFLIQVFAAVILVYGDIRIKTFQPFFVGGSQITFGYLFSSFISVIWIVGITNTLNFIDGLDGLTGGIAAISSLTIAYISLTNNRIEIAVLTLIMAGASLGFLPYNFNPAKIFMGDTGALFLGFMLSAISIEGTIKGAIAITVIAPILALGIPIFDTSFAIFRRIKNGTPPWEADRGHLHHRILDMGIGYKKTVILLYFIHILFGLSVIFLINKDIIKTMISFLLALLLIAFPIRKSMKNKKRRD